MIRSSLIVSLLAALGTVISFVGQLILAHVLGAGPELDAYLVAISLPMTIAGLGGGVLGYQVVPALRRAQNSTGDILSSLSGMILGLGGGMACLAVSIAACAPWLVPLLAGSLPTSQHAELVHTFIIAWTWPTLTVIAAILTAGLHMREKFVFATMVQPLPAIGAAVGCLLFYRSHGIGALAWGQLAGYILLAAFLATRLRLRLGPIDWTQTRQIFSEMPMGAAALLVFVIYPLPDAIWGGHAGSAGVSLLGYGQRLIVGFAGLAVVGATTVLFPRLARQASAGDSTGFKDDLSRSLRIMLACMAPAAAVFAVLALPVVRVLLVRGAFGEPEAEALANLLLWMLPGMVAMSAMTLVFKAYFAQGHIYRAAAISVGGAILYFAMSGLLVGHMGLSGIGAAYALTWWLVFALSVTMLRLIAMRDALFVIRLFLITLTSASVAWLGRETLLAPHLGDIWLQVILLAAISGVSALAFIATCLVWPGLEDIRLVTRRLLGNQT